MLGRCLAASYSEPDPAQPQLASSSTPQHADTLLRLAQRATELLSVSS